MKISDHLLKFPRHLPNDLEGLVLYYPEKFPPVVEEFKKAALKIAGSPEAFRKYGDWARDELWEAFEKIAADYQKGDQSNLEFLVEIDERFNKMYCYRFWIVNYLFPDGPIHDYIVDNLKNLIRKFIDVSEEIEDFEQKIVRIQRDLLQGDYADLYLQQAIDGIKVLELLEINETIATKLPEVTGLIDRHNHDSTERINEIWSEIYEIIKNSKETDELREALSVAIRQVEMRGTLLPMYNMLTHAVEFREENRGLAKRHGEMQETIEEYKKMAKKELTGEEYELFEFCYEQARNFIIYKDVMGAIDEKLLPLWFGLHQQIKQILIDRGVKIRERPTGPTAVGDHFVWYLPDDLKAKVMTSDLVPFDIQNISSMLQNLIPAAPHELSATNRLSTPRNINDIPRRASRFSHEISTARNESRFYTCSRGPKN